jgi:hypothetical protein
MAVNDSRSMNHEMIMGITDNSYITLTPNRANVENPPFDRLSWPTYAQAERHFDPSHREGHEVQSLKPVENKVRQGVEETRF